jgi:hypothetical protein
MLGRLIGMNLVAVLTAALPSFAQELFRDSFENGLSNWTIQGEKGIQILETEDPDHRSVLLLQPQGDVYALVKDSEKWGSVRIEGEVLFPTAEHNYLGIIYNFRLENDRADFGLIYIKGNGSYIRVNPHRDFNVGRTLYEEYRTPLEGNAAIQIGQWQDFAAEVIGNTCHFYVGGSATPQVNFSHLELDHGAVGVHPRSVGGDVWVDNVVVSRIEAFSYKGEPDLTAHPYQPDSLITQWQVAGPFERTMDELARDPQSDPAAWQPFETDGRGAVITARVVDYHGPRPVAYFRARVRSDQDGLAYLHLSTVDDLALWVNGRFHWFIQRDRFAWYDFWSNSAHEGRRIPIELNPGENDIVLRVRGGVYATGGFFARLER